MKDEKVELLQNVIRKYQIFTNWVIKHTPEILESERGLNYVDDIDLAEHNVREFEEQIKLSEPVTDEDVMTYFNLHASLLKKETPIIQVMTRGDVLKFAKWLQSKLSK
jgi:hypothetical protein